MKNRQKENKPASVHGGETQSAKQAGESQDRWSWVEPSVWTERMLAALANGVKGGKWFSLIDKVVSKQNLGQAFMKVKSNRGSAGVDNQSINMFEARKEENLAKLQEQLLAGTYRPQPVKRVWIPKPGKRNEKRPLGIPTVRDRIVQTALRNVIEPIFEQNFAEQSYGFRPGRGCKDALRRVDELLRQGYTWIIDADLKSYFDTIPHKRLMTLLEEDISDGRVLELVEKFLNQEVMEQMEGWTPEKGTPQGAVVSPLLSNIYLNPLDQLMATSGYEMVRYADDFVLLCRTEEEAHRVLEQVRAWTDDVELILHPEKTIIVDVTQPGGFDFLGYHFERGHRWPRKKSLQKLKDTIRTKTKRNNGWSLEMIITNVNRTLKGWFEYFKHSHKTTFPVIDQWIRMRLRSILRRRMGLKGRGRGKDHHRWPNAFFAEQGLFSLVAARVEVCQSAQR